MRGDGRGLAARGAVDVLGRRWPAAELRVPGGDPRIVIPEHAEEGQTDLLVVGGRGLGAVGRFMLGSVSDAAARAAHCAVLVVKGEPGPLRRVLIAIDGSEPALVAARFVAALPLDPATVIRLVGVAEPVQCPAPIAVPMLPDVMTDLLAERRLAIDAALVQAEAVFRGRPGTVERVIASGRPADEILAAAAAGAIDLIVTGARGLGPVKRLLLGSVSERVLHRADGPVLVVKGSRR